MKIFFTKLTNGDWICYDSHNHGGDRFVDPAKIQILFDLVEASGGQVIRHNDDLQAFTLHQEATIKLDGFGPIRQRNYVYCVDGIIQSCIVRTHCQDGNIGEFNSSFVLELNDLPAFDFYKWSDDDDEKSN